MILKTNMVKKTFSGLCLMSGLLLTQTNAFGAATLTIQQSSGGTVATLSGTINTSGLTYSQNNGFINIISGINQLITLGVNPSDAYASTTNKIYSGISGGASWGYSYGTPTAVSGVQFTLNSNQIMLPASYQSGTAISSSATWSTGFNMTPGTYTYTWGAGSNADTLSVIITSPASAPTVASVSPTSGSTAGGTAITITGTDLTGATAITVGGAACTNVVASATSATCITPAGTAGTASVLVTTPGGTNAVNTLFTYVTPVAAPIPTLSEWAMIFLASLMAMVVWVRTRRQ